ncbi:MAG: amino acid adenylation domain-containing protein [Acidobacteriota bacterium]|nr:amino acid adenylation domain-containing protein [Acidobacteriota bacterium]
MKSSDLLEKRIAALPPEKRRLLELRLRKEGLDEVGGEIPRAAAADHYPLTFGQQRLWFIDQLVPGSAAYNIPFAGRLVGRLRYGPMAQSLNQLVQRHAVLRSRFTKVDGQAVQIPIPPEELPVLPLRVLDLSRLGDRAEAEMERLTAAEGRQPFDLEEPPLARLSLLRMPDPEEIPQGVDADEVSDHLLAVTMPHLVTDAWSMALFFQELPELYDARLAGRPPQLPELTVQVHDYAVWQRRRFSGPRLEKEMEFWKRQLDGAPTVLELPTDRPRPARQSFRGERYAVQLPAQLSARMEAFHRHHGVTPFMLYLAVFGALLHRYSGQRDLLVGSPVVTREQESARQLIGFFINIAVLRLDLREQRGREVTFRTFLERVRDMCLASFAHQEVPFERLVEEFWHRRTLRRNPLVQVTFVLQNVGITHPDFEELELRHFRQTGTRTARDDLTLGFWEGNEAMAGWWEYPTDLFDQSTIERMSGHLLRLMEGVLEDPERPLAELPMLSAQERHQLLTEWQGGTEPAARPNLAELFLRAADAHPEAPALYLSPPSTTLTYRALAALARRFAHRLRRAGVGPEVPVPILLPTSPQLVVAILGTVLAGGYSVPLDPRDPASRRRQLLGLLRQTAPEAPPVLVAEEGFEDAEENLWTVLMPELSDSPPASDSEEAAPFEPLITDPSQLAYLMFTSGSSGRPKAVAVPHGAVVRLLQGLRTPRAVLRLGPGEVLFQLAPPSFDASTLELWGALATGAALALPAGSQRSLEEITGGIEAYGVTTLWLTAGLFHLMVEKHPDALAKVPQLLAGGDRLAAPAVRAALARVAREPVGEGRSAPAVINGYGPTEATVFTTCRRFEPGDEVSDSVSLGWPLGGTRVVVASATAGAHLQPVGVPGELLIGGDGLARGYLGDPRATALAFRPDPFASEASAGGAGARLYHSGDGARRLPDGSLDFLGRLDRQVKVRGLRVEPGEIEAALTALPEIESAAVTTRPSPGGEGIQLVAFAVSKQTEEELRGALAERLPANLLPARIVPIAQLPLTDRGKVDRGALLDLLSEEQTAELDDQPRDAVEERLAAIWAELLGRPRVGIHDDWFALGGDSILSIQALARAAEAGIRLQPEAIFTHPTIARLATVAELEEERGPVEAPPGPVPLTTTQRWFFELPLEHPEHWNLALWVVAPRRLTVESLHTAAARLVQRHDALRLSFEGDGAELHQQLHGEAAAPAVTVRDLRQLPPSELDQELEAAADALQGGFDLAHRQESSLLRLMLAELPESSASPTGEAVPQRLLLVVHHLVADTVSCAVLAEELLALAEEPDRALTPATPFALWARGSRTARGSRMDTEPRDELSPAPLLDHPEADGREAAVQRLSRRLPVELTEDLYQRAGEAYGTRPDELLLTALARTLADRAAELEPGTHTISLCLEGHGRDGGHGDAAGQEVEAGEEWNLARTVGWLTRLTGVELKLGDGFEDDPGGDLTRVKEGLRQQLRAGGASPRGLPVAFNHLGRLDRMLAASGIRVLDAPVGTLHHPEDPRPFPLELLVYSLEDRLHLLWSYDRRLETATVEALAAALEEHLETLVSHCLDPKAGGFTPSDFPQVEISQQSLDQLMNRIAGGSADQDEPSS